MGDLPIYNVQFSEYFHVSEDKVKEIVSEVMEKKSIRKNFSGFINSEISIAMAYDYGENTFLCTLPEFTTSTMK